MKYFILAMLFVTPLFAGDFVITTPSPSTFTPKDVTYKMSICRGNPGSRVCCLQFEIMDLSNEPDPKGSLDICFDVNNQDDTMTNMSASEKQNLNAMFKRMACSHPDVVAMAGCN